MNIFIPLLIVLVTASTFFLIGQEQRKTLIRKYNKLNITVDTVRSLHPLVLKVYRAFIDNEQIKYFQQEPCEIKLSNLNIAFWSVNAVEHKRFTEIPESILKELNQSKNEINNSLSLADKTVLNMIARAVEVNNKEFIDRLFI